MWEKSILNPSTNDETITALPQINKFLASLGEIRIQTKKVAFFMLTLCVVTHSARSPLVAIQLALFFIRINNYYYKII